MCLERTTLRYDFIEGKKNMRELLTIGEFAKLMRVSTHQIRYYEEKAVLFPSNIDENGYRMYGLNEIYILSHILLLRKLNIPVANIKECFQSYEKEQYTELLKNSISDLDKHINQLIELREFTKNIIDKSQNINFSKDKYTVKSLENRKVKQIYKANYAKAFSPKHFYKNIVNKGDYLNLYEADLITLYDDTDIYVCINADASTEYIHELMAGEYLCFTFLSDSDEEFQNTINMFFKYAKENHINITGKLIVIENSMQSIFYNNEIYYEIQMLIERKL